MRVAWLYGIFAHPLVHAVKSDAFERKLKEFDSLLGEAASLFHDSGIEMKNFQYQLADRDFLITLPPGSLKPIMQCLEVCHATSKTIGSRLLGLGEGIETDFQGFLYSIEGLNFVGTEAFSALKNLAKIVGNHDIVNPILKLGNRWKEVATGAAVLQNNMKLSEQRIKKSQQQYVREGKVRFFVTSGIQGITRFNDKQTEKAIQEFTHQMDSVLEETIKFADRHWTSVAGVSDLLRVLKTVGDRKFADQRILDLRSVGPAILAIRDTLVTIECDENKHVVNKWRDLVKQCLGVAERVVTVRHAHLHPEDYDIEAVMKKFGPTCETQLSEMTMESEGDAGSETVAVEQESGDSELKLERSKIESSVEIKEGVGNVKGLSNDSPKQRNQKRTRLPGWSVADFLEAQEKRQSLKKKQLEKVQKRRSLQKVDEDCELVIPSQGPALTESVDPLAKVDDSSYDLEIQRLLRGRVPRPIHERTLVPPHRKPPTYFGPLTAVVSNIDDLSIEEQSRLVRPISEFHVSQMRSRANKVCNTLREMQAQCEAVLATAVESETVNSALAFKRKICAAYQVLLELENSAIEFEAQAYAMPSLLIKESD